jgi:hemolysin III
MTNSGRWVNHGREPFSGLSHLAGFVLAVVGAGVLAVLARDGQRIAALIYAASLVLLYAASSAYHLVDRGHAVTMRLRRLDHAAIFFLIAGTSTPLFVAALGGGARVFMLAAVWGMALVGVLFRTFWLTAPRWLYTATYLATGWVVVLRWKAVVAGLGSGAFALLVAGGVVYSLGALVYALKWPDPRPGRFGFHEVWHLFVLVASALHFAAIAVVVAG